jgi:hopanoid biosynthesis associated radical SAM protein HpnH
LKSDLTYEQCMKAVDECPAPIVSIPGGEPLMHPEIDRIVRGLIERKKYIYLCTNALLLEEKLHLFEPTKYLSFSVHMDGLEAEHDFAVCREGTFKTARAAIAKAIERGFRVTTNTTLFDGADPKRTQDFFDDMMELGVEGMMVSPGYQYEKAPDQGHFLGRERTKELFRNLLHGNEKRWRFNQSTLFLEFLAGGHDYDCTPWGNPTFSVFGWQKPCYLLQEGYASSFQELMEETEWKNYGPKSGNPHCRDCMVHSGFEASAVEDIFSSVSGFTNMVKAAIFGPKIEAPHGEVAAPTQAVGCGAGASTHEDQEDAAQGWSGPANAKAFKIAFDYRGDVTLHLDDGSQAEGYVANLSPESLHLWERGKVSTLEIAHQRIVRVELTGRDTASGRSWETWIKTHPQAHAN